MRFLALLPLVALGCGGSTESTPTTTDASSTTDTAAADTGTASDAPSTDAVGDAECDLGSIPTVAPFASEFIFVGGDAGATIPTPTGGDPKGNWRFTKVTIYLSEGARSLVDVSKSTVTGTGYQSYTDTTFRNMTDQKIVLETTVAGTITRGTFTKGKGTYKMEGNELVFTPECSASTTEGAPPRLGWSTIDADHARAQFKPPPSGMGDFTQQLVLDLERIK